MMIRNSIAGLIIDSPLFEKVCKRAGQLAKSTIKSVVKSDAGTEVVSALSTNLAEKGTSYLLKRDHEPTFLERWLDIA